MKTNAPSEDSDTLFAFPFDSGDDTDTGMDSNGTFSSWKWIKVASNASLDGFLSLRIKALCAKPRSTTS